jgi:hypothetical protein
MKICVKNLQKPNPAGFARGTMHKVRSFYTSFGVFSALLLIIVEFSPHPRGIAK